MRLRLAKKLRKRVLRRWFEPGSPTVEQCAAEVGVPKHRLDRVVRRLERYWRRGSREVRSTSEETAQILLDLHRVDGSDG